MFRTLIYPSSGAYDCAVELPHWSFCSRFVVRWRFGAAGFEWCLCCRLQRNNRPKHVENIEIVNKMIIVTLIGCLHYCI